MAKQFPKLDTYLREFISRQQMFFTGSATDTSRVNISPRSTDLFRIVDDNSVLYLDRIGSGNETAAHMLADGRMTIMFCAVDGKPMILRLYGRGQIIPRDSDEYKNYLTQLFSGSEIRGARQIVKLNFDLVQTSCGFGVPRFDYREERDTLDHWAHGKTDEELLDYRVRKNRLSIDGLPTAALEES
ncbi:MAG: pyridoxamine 5'-phosphate oxidase family protein [Stappiaceae bacterium]